MDLHRRRSVLVRMTADGKRLETARITNGAAELRREIAKAGEHPQVVLEATYGWYWAADELAAAGAEVHLAHPLGVKAFTYRRVKNDPLTEQSNVFAAQMGYMLCQPTSGMSARSESQGRCSPIVSPIAGETGHTRLNRSPAFSSLPIFDVSSGRPRELLQCP